MLKHEKFIFKFDELDFQLSIFQAISGCLKLQSCPESINPINFLPTFRWELPGNSMPFLQALRGQHPSKKVSSWCGCYHLKALTGHAAAHRCCDDTSLPSLASETLLYRACCHFIRPSHSHRLINMTGILMQ